jgi:Ca-activated chloride channel family protein
MRSSGFGNLNAPKAASAPSTLAVTGADAVVESKRARERQELAYLREEDRTESVRRVTGKTFYLINGVWTDSEFKAEAKLPETGVKFGSEEYFALLKQHPKLGSYFALGEKVVVVFEGRVYRVF